MAPGYISALRNNLPRARLVLGRFHVVKRLNEKLTELRRELYREANDGLFKQALKGTRWLLLKNFENLDEARNQHDRLTRPWNSTNRWPPRAISRKGSGSDPIVLRRAAS